MITKDQRTQINPVAISAIIGVQQRGSQNRGMGKHGMERDRSQVPAARAKQKKQGDQQCYTQARMAREGWRAGRRSTDTHLHSVAR